jgi:gas vesicle protein
MRSFMALLTGALCGALFGAGIALLVAPYSGKELRGRIQTRATEFGDEVRDAYDDRRAQLESELARLRAPRSSSAP